MKTKTPMPLLAKGSQLSHSTVVLILPTHETQIRMGFTTLPKGIPSLRMHEITLPTSVTILPTLQLVFAEVVL